ncbi:hypothetical protein Tco_0604789, partial [Tanacetum coccineum]
DLDLWGDLRMIFDPNEEDDIWLNQQYWELLRWKLHEYSGVHFLFLDVYENERSLKFIDAIYVRPIGGDSPKSLLQVQADTKMLILTNVHEINTVYSYAPIIEDWVSDCDEDETVVLESLNVQKPKQADQPRKFGHNAIGQSSKIFPKSRKNFAPTAVLTKRGLVPFSTTRQSFLRTTTPVSAARSFKTAAPKPSVNVGKQKTNAFQKPESVNTAKEKEVTRLLINFSFIKMENLEFCDKHNIVNWEYILLGMTEAKDSEVCRITRKDGSSSFHGDIQALLRRLDRQDLRQLYSLVQERFKDHPLIN